MEGWIKLHRKIQNHWIWQDDKYFKWWSTILLNVNHIESKFPVGDEIFICKKGQSFRSIDSWTGLFRCSKKTTISFLKMLQKDGMIFTETLGKGNRRKHLLTVVNWKDYQIEETENSTETVPETPPEGNRNVPPNKNDKNKKNDKNNKNNTWRNDFEIYKSELFPVYEELLTDQDFITKQEKFHPGVDIKLSLEKAVTNFWGKEAGWKHKKKSRTTEIDWKSTLTNAIDKNKVYYGTKKIITSNRSSFESDTTQRTIESIVNRFE